MGADAMRIETAFVCEKCGKQFAVVSDLADDLAKLLTKEGETQDQTYIWFHDETEATRRKEHAEECRVSNRPETVLAVDSPAGLEAKTETQGVDGVAPNAGASEATGEIE
jgi:uncharacterized protein (DUF2345 family)